MEQDDFSDLENFRVVPGKDELLPDNESSTPSSPPAPLMPNASSAAAARAAAEAPPAGLRDVAPAPPAVRAPSWARKLVDAASSVVPASWRSQPLPAPVVSTPMSSEPAMNKKAI